MAAAAVCLAAAAVCFLLAQKDCFAAAADCILVAAYMGLVAAADTAMLTAGCILAATNRVVPAAESVLRVDCILGLDSFLVAVHTGFVALSVDLLATA